MGSVAYPSNLMELRWVTTRTKKDETQHQQPKRAQLETSSNRTQTHLTSTLQSSESSSQSAITPATDFPGWTLKNQLMLTSSGLLSHTVVLLSLFSPDHMIVLRLILLVILSPLSNLMMGLKRWFLYWEIWWTDWCRFLHQMASLWDLEGLFLMWDWLLLSMMSW